MNGLKRLFGAKSIAVVGGGAWCENILGAAKRIGYRGQIFPVHPSGKEIAGMASLRSLAEWEGSIDAAFIGVNRHVTIGIVEELQARGAGGAICFASGFAEAEAEDAESASLQTKLVSAAQQMPILGPNCYGFVNAMDQVAIWPDQHGMVPVERGVAILTQSSNIAINLTMQQRALPIAFMVTCGNQAQTTQAQMAEALLEDPRITAIGVHIEGFGDVQAWHRMALKAHEKGIPIVAVKVGASEQAKVATVSHTASLAGDDAGADALLRRLGIGRVRDLPTFVETLKLMHMVGRLSSPTVSTISCSGGEASLSADTVKDTRLSLPPLSDMQRTNLRDALGPMVALANPLDYHTYIWRDVDAMTATWCAMTSPDIGMTLAIVDYPHTDATDWACATDAACRTRKETGLPFGMVATLPELMPLDVAEKLMAEGVVPLLGLSEAIAAIEIAATLQDVVAAPPLPGGEVTGAETITEIEAKFALSAHDLDLPRRVEASFDELALAARPLLAPLALKGVGIAHKSELGAVALGLSHQDLEERAASMPTERFLIEEMITDGVAELLVGVTRDPAHGMVMTLGAGGVMTEVWQDTTSLLLPVEEADILAALKQLKVNKLFDGFRGNPPASRPAIVAAVMAIQAYVVKHLHALAEVEVNPLICTPTRAVAVDALIRRAP